MLRDQIDRRSPMQRCTGPIVAVLLGMAISSAALAARDVLDTTHQDLRQAMEEENPRFGAFSQMALRLNPNRSDILTFGSFMEMPPLDLLPTMLRSAADEVPAAAAKLSAAKSAEAVKFAPRLTKLAKEAETLHKQLQARPADARPYVEWRRRGQFTALEEMAKRANEGDKKVETELLKTVRLAQKQGLMPQILRLAASWDDLRGEILMLWGSTADNPVFDALTETPRIAGARAAFNRSIADSAAESAAFERRRAARIQRQDAAREAAAADLRAACVAAAQNNPPCMERNQYNMCEKWGAADTSHCAE